MARSPIYAAGGIVTRGRARTLVAVVQRSKDECWVLPRGKLKRKENPIAGARREVVEETGHRVRVHEFLGAITYRARGRSKVVEFWHMQAAEQPSREVMSDIIAVDWLPLAAAVRRLSYPLEKLFLQQAGRRVLRRRKARAAKRKALKTRADKSRLAALRLRWRAGRRRLHLARSRRRSAAPARIAAAKQKAGPRIVGPGAARRRKSMLRRVFGRLGR